MDSDQAPRNEPTKLDEAEMSRIFDYFLHEDDVFNDRMNGFIQLQAMMIAAFAIIVGQKPTHPRIKLEASLVALVFIAVILCSVWFYTQYKQMVVFKSLRQRSIELFPEIQKQVHLRRRRWTKVSNLSVLTYLPLIFLLLWISLGLATL